MATKKKELGFNATASIERLRQVAAEAGDSLLTEGYVQPDHELLDLCAEALHHLTHAQRAWEARRKLEWYGKPKEEADRLHAKDQALYEDWQAEDKKGKAPLLRISRIKATTPAGIYAKAMVCRASVTGAAGLALSLAADFLACEELRKALWPAEPV